MRPDTADISRCKDALRAELIAARRARSAAERQAAQEANGAHLLAALAGRRCVAAYLPLPSEPLDVALLDRLSAVTTVLVPVTVGAAPLDWCRYPTPVRPGALGIDEPTGERLGPETVGSADAVLVPALAVDRAGHRLGRGGGHYDRTLALRARHHPDDAVLIAVLYDGEVLDAVPFDEFDRQVSAVVTPAVGVIPVG